MANFYGAMQCSSGAMKCSSIRVDRPMSSMSSTFKSQTQTNDVKEKREKYEEVDVHDYKPKAVKESKQKQSVAVQEKKQKKQVEQQVQQQIQQQVQQQVQQAQQQVQQQPPKIQIEQLQEETLQQAKYQELIQFAQADGRFNLQNSILDQLKISEFQKFYQLNQSLLLTLLSLFYLDLFCKESRSSWQLVYQKGMAFLLKNGINYREEKEKYIEKYQELFLN